MNIDLEGIRKAISNIPKQERRALILRDILGFTYKEIAEILNVKVNSVGVYIHRARVLVFSDDIEDCWWEKKNWPWCQLIPCFKIEPVARLVV